MKPKIYFYPLKEKKPSPIIEILIGILVIVAVLTVYTFFEA